MLTTKRLGGGGCDSSFWLYLCNFSHSKPLCLIVSLNDSVCPRGGKKKFGIGKKK